MTSNYIYVGKSLETRVTCYAVVPAASTLPSRMLVYASQQVSPWYYQLPVQVGYQHPNETLKTYFRNDKNREMLM